MFDRLGMLLSGVCLVHCIALPLILLVFPSILMTQHADTTVHWVLLGIAVPVSGFALWQGFRRHGSRYAILLGTLGLVLLTLGVLHVMGQSLEAPLTVVGVIALAAAHWINLRGYQHE